MPCSAGIGGGELDAAKALAHYASAGGSSPDHRLTDAPCSALSVIYTDDGIRKLLMPHNPNMVVVDARIVAGASSPAGRRDGDALATV